MSTLIAIIRKGGDILRKIILASHGSLAQGMLSAAKMILVTCDDITAYDLENYANPIDIYEKLYIQIQKEPTVDYIILCDLNGGSVHNQMVHLCRFKNVYLVAGMTLSMILEIVLANHEDDTKTVLKKAIESSIRNTVLLDHEIAEAEVKKGLVDDKLW